MLSIALAFKCEEYRSIKRNVGDNLFEHCLATGGMSSSSRMI